DESNVVVEAMRLDHRQTRKSKVIISSTVHPEHRQLVETAANGQKLDIVEIGHKDGVTDVAQLEKELDEDTAAVIVQYPNFFGLIEPLAEINALIEKQKKTMFVVS